MSDSALGDELRAAAAAPSLLAETIADLAGPASRRIDEMAPALAGVHSAVEELRIAEAVAADTAVEIETGWKARRRARATIGSVSCPWCPKGSYPLLRAYALDPNDRRARRWSQWLVVPVAGRVHTVDGAASAPFWLLNVDETWRAQCPEHPERPFPVDVPALVSR